MKRTNIYVERGDWEWYESYAQKLRRTTSSVIREAMEMFRTIVENQETMIENGRDDDPMS